MDTLKTLFTGNYVFMAIVGLMIAWWVPDDTPRRWRLRLIITVMAAGLIFATWRENKRRIEAFYSLQHQLIFEGALVANKKELNKLRLHLKRFQEQVAELPQPQRTEVERLIPEQIQEFIQSTE